MLAYELGGGTANDDPWIAVGCLSENSAGGRIVLELLSLPVTDEVLLRVFREEPTELVWAALLRPGDLEVSDDAVRTFLKAVENEVLVDARHEYVQRRAALLPELEADAALILYPTPPPVDPTLLSDLRKRPN